MSSNKPNKPIAPEAPKLTVPEARQNLETQLVQLLAQRSQLDEKIDALMDTLKGFDLAVQVRKESED